MASRTSLTPRSTGVPMANCTMVLERPSETIELISSMPLMPRTAASTRCVTCVSSSVGAAPGWLTTTCAAGKVTSGLSLISIVMKLSTPAMDSIRNATIGGTGLRIDQLEMLRMGLSPPCLRAPA